MCFALAAAIALGACRGRDADRPSAATVATRVADAKPPSPPVAPVPAATVNVPTRMALTGVAPGTLYVCVTRTNGETHQTAIELPPHVADVCRKAPEMGPCQYERETCRRNGGRVFAADGTEITRETETAYDKRVLRIRMKSN